MPPKTKRPRRRYARQNNKKAKQKVIQKVSVNVNSSGGSGGGGSSQPYYAPSAFYDRMGENVVLQRLSDKVNAFMAKAQMTQAIEPVTPAPSTYIDSPVDEVAARTNLIREARLGNPILNPRPNNNSKSLLSQVSESTQTEMQDPELEPPTTPRALPDVPFEIGEVEVEPTGKEKRKQDKINYIENQRDALIKKLTELQSLNAINDDDYVTIGSANYKTKKAINDALKKVSNMVVSAQLKSRKLSPIQDENTRVLY